jgi:hypothetical protein
MRHAGVERQGIDGILRQRKYAPAHIARSDAEPACAGGNRQRGGARRGGMRNGALQNLRILEFLKAERPIKLGNAFFDAFVVPLVEFQLNGVVVRLDGS